MKEAPKLLGIVVENNGKSGPLHTVKEYYEGWHPELGGTLIHGLSGPETLVSKKTVKPVATFTVFKNPSDNGDINCAEGQSRTDI